MDERHHEREAQVGDPLDALSVGVPGEAVALGQVAGVAHRDHPVVPEEEHPVSRHHRARAVDVAEAPQNEEKRDREQGEAGRALGPSVAI